jgi:hypothetical protein
MMDPQIKISGKTLGLVALVSKISIIIFIRKSMFSIHAIFGCMRALKV